MLQRELHPERCFSDFCRLRHLSGGVWCAGVPGMWRRDGGRRQFNKQPVTWRFLLWPARARWSELESRRALRVCLAECAGSAGRQNEGSCDRLAERSTAAPQMLAFCAVSLGQLDCSAYAGFGQQRGTLCVKLKQTLLFSGTWEVWMLQWSWQSKVGALLPLACIAPAQTAPRTPLNAKPLPWIAV